MCGRGWGVEGGSESGVLAHAEKKPPGLQTLGTQCLPTKQPMRMDAQNTSPLPVV